MQGYGGGDVCYNNQPLTHFSPEHQDKMSHKPFKTLLAIRLSLEVAQDNLKLWSVLMTN